MHIVSTAPDVTEILCALGLESSIVGISKHCDFPQSVRYKRIVSDYQEVTNVDALRAYRPDLAIGSTNLQKDVARTLVEHNVPTLVLAPTTLESVFHGIQLIGKVTDTRREASALVDKMRAGFDEIRSQARKLARTPRAMVEEWGDPLIVGVGWIGELIEIAGGNNVFRELVRKPDTADRTVDPGEAARRNPEVVMAAWCGMRGEVDLGKITARPGWEKVPAVRNQQVHAVDDAYFTRPGPRLVEGARMLQELFTDAAASA